MMSIYLILRIQLSFVQCSFLCCKFCILSKTECKSIYYHFWYDHEYRSFRKLTKNKWICWETYYFSSPFSRLLQIIKIINVFSKMYDVLGFLNFLYLPQITQQIFFILIVLVIENILVLFYHSFHIY